MSTKQLGIDGATFRFRVHLEILHTVWPERPWAASLRQSSTPTPRPLASDKAHLSDRCNQLLPFDSIRIRHLYKEPPPKKVNSVIIRDGGGFFI